MLTVFVESEFSIRCILLKVQGGVGHHETPKVLNQVGHDRFTFSTTNDERFWNFDFIRSCQRPRNIFGICRVCAGLFSFSSPLLGMVTLYGK